MVIIAPKGWWSIGVLVIAFLGLTIEYQAGSISFMLWISLILLLLMVFWIRDNMTIRGRQVK